MRPPAPPPPAEGFTRVTLAPGNGYDFDGPRITNDAPDLSWDGSTISGGPGTTFVPGEHFANPGDAPPAPAGATKVTSLAPSPGQVIYVYSGEQTYTLWVPPHDGGAADGSLTFDWARTPPMPAAESALPNALKSLSLPRDIFSAGPDVAATNAGVTLGIVLLLLVGGSLFNRALEENVRGWGLRRLPVPVPMTSVFAGFGESIRAGLRWWRAIMPGRTWLDYAFAPALLLILTGLIYSLLEPSFGWNRESLTLFVSLVASQGVLVLVYEGGKAWLYRHSLNVEAGLSLFPACIGIALVSVAISRTADFEPGLVVGFIASASIRGNSQFTADQRGRAWALMAAIMLAISVGAWFLAMPLQVLSESSDSAWAALPESIALSIFVVCLQGLMFSLIPLEFMDGWRIWKWSRLAWVALFVPTAFIFMQVMFNDSEAYMGLLTSTKSFIGIAVLILYIGITFGTWAYLKQRAERQQRPAPAGPADAPAISAD